MADPKDNRKPAKTALELFLAKIRPKPEKSPEPSYFDKPEPDREEERRQAIRHDQAIAAQKAASEVQDKDRLTKAFAPVSLSDEIKLDERIAAIAQDDLREAATEAREDAQELLEMNRAKIQEVYEKDRKFYDRYNLSLPVPEDTARQQNKDRNDAIEALYRQQIAIQDTKERAIAKLEAESWKRTLQITNGQLQIAHQPAEPPVTRPPEQPTTLAGWLSDIHRAAAALPPPPPTPGVDMSR